jgi:hypothetical protein
MLSCMPPREVREYSGQTKFATDIGWKERVAAELTPISFSHGPPADPQNIEDVPTNQP